MDDRKARMYPVARKARSAFIRLRRFLVSARFGASPDTVYQHTFYDDIGFSKTEDTARIITAYLFNTFHPASVLDLGCGTGAYLKHFEALGCQVVGVEGSSVGISRIHPAVLAVHHDLRRPLLINQQFDLVMSVEVAEHIPKKFSENVVQSLCRHARGLIVFTAAPPGTPGEDHINCRARSFWDALFERQGFVFDPDKTEDLVRHARQHDTAVWFQQWAYVYVARRPRGSLG
jgi:SAM-dependent methyltransferase